MIVTTDWRRRWQPVRLEMSEEEFREIVEWLEMVAPGDGCTRDWRAQHDRLFPPRPDLNAAAPHPKARR